MVDIIFASVPYTDTDEPVMAPALLKAVATQHGFTSVALDLNIEILNKIKSQPNVESLLEFFSYAKEKPELANDVAELIDYCAYKILSFNPKIIGLSLLTSQCQLFTLWLLIKLRSVSPDIKIIIGGSGIKNFVADSSNTFCDRMLSLKLIDHYIVGDGEVSVVEFLKGNLQYPGIDSMNWIQPTDLDQFNYPDFRDYNFDQYDKKVIPITDSRGCVRACEFCDIIEHWKKYVYRSAESVFNEMIYQIKTHNISSFSMRNSLTNGNMKEFKKLLDLISDYNECNEDQQISWEGYFIIRESSQHPEEIFNKIKKSNGTLLLGVESVIEHVRYEMGKKFSNDAIDYHLKLTQKYQIPITLLIMTGNPTETRTDYEFTKQWFKDRYEYAGNSVTRVYLSIASIFPGTEWERKQNDLNLQIGKYPSIWINQDTRITAEERSKHWTELLEICKPYMSETYTANIAREQSTALNVIKSYGQDF